MPQVFALNRRFTTDGPLAFKRAGAGAQHRILDTRFGARYLTEASNDYARASSLDGVLPPTCLIEPAAPAERIEITSAASFLQKDSGSIVCDIRPIGDHTVAGNRVLIAYSATLYLYYDGTSDKFTLYNGSGTAEATARTWAAFGPLRIALSWGPTGALAVIAQPGVDTVVIKATFTPPGSIPATLYLGTDTAGANGFGAAYGNLELAGTPLR